MGAGICVPDDVHAVEQPLAVYQATSEFFCKAVAAEGAVEIVQPDLAEKATVREETAEDSEQEPPSESADHLKSALLLEPSVAFRMTSADTTDETDIPGYSFLAVTSDSESGEEAIRRSISEDSTTAFDNTADILSSEIHKVSASTASVEETNPEFLSDREDSHLVFASPDTAFTVSHASVVDLKSRCEAAVTPSLPIVFEHQGKLTEVRFEKRPLGFEFGGKFVAPSGKFVITNVVRPELKDVVKLGMLIKKVGDETTANLVFQDFAALLEVASKPLPEDA
eukprot:TRINITY_DN20180_c0_g1_i1.p1 TRINITY_DN20180_c0_g1~~TRINITY_DN20180_c0_g1_i1.p1  ORF type:complete len:282 (-),score=70.89 TRINITY_DN20180_c0_g1_i1:263-1108(-)